MRKKILLLAMMIMIGFSYGKAQSPHTSKPSSPSMLKGKGMLSFTLNGQLHKSDSTQTKCWTTAQIPLAMLWAKGTDMLISWQIQTVPGAKGTYKIDKDTKGTVNFTIGNKTYWVRKTD